MDKLTQRWRPWHQTLYCFKGQVVYASASVGACKYRRAAPRSNCSSSEISWPSKYVCVFSLQHLFHLTTRFKWLSKLFADDLREEGVHGVSRIVGPPASSLLWCRATQKGFRIVAQSFLQNFVHQGRGKWRRWTIQTAGNVGFFWFLKSWFDQTFDHLSLDSFHNEDAIWPR